MPPTSSSCKGLVRWLVVVAAATALFAMPAPVDAAPVDLPPTFTPSTLRARAGQVIGVSGANCTLGGRAMQTADVMFSIRNQRDTFSQVYQVREDGSWSGWFVVPQHLVAGGNYVIESVCAADDMVVQGQRHDFEVVAGSAPTVAVTRSGDTAEVAGAGCVEGGQAHDNAAVMIEPERTGQFAPGFWRRPLPEPASRPTVAADGSFLTQVTLPGPGPWEVYARCWNDDLTLETAFQPVAVPDQQTTSPPSDATGKAGGAKTGPPRGASFGPPTADPMAEVPTDQAASSRHPQRAETASASPSSPSSTARTVAALILGITTSAATATMWIRRRRTPLRV